MRIEKPPLQPPQMAWEPFFEKFTLPPTKEQRKEMIELFAQHLSHQIYRHMQRMINAYKKMRYGDSDG